MQFEKLDKKRINIVNFFETEIKKIYKSSKFTIEIIKQDNLKEFYVEIDKDVFKETIQNFIKNAERHGFIENKQYRIQFEISKIILSDNSIKSLIIYRNDGEPFPDGFTFEEFKRLTGRAGKNRGSGIGGFFINKAIELHGGSLKYIEIKDSTFNVQFEILLPIK